MRAAASFFGLVLLLSLPFYAVGVAHMALPFAAALPLSALMAIVPMIGALALIAHNRGALSAGMLFTSAFRFRLIPSLGWAVIATAFMPAAFTLTAGMVWLSGTALPTLNLLSLSAIISAFALFFVGAVGEELGWQGYAFPALTEHHSALTAALIIGVVWGLWHVIPFALMGRSAGWIIWQSAGMVLMRITIVCLVVNAGRSILIAVLFHMMSNSVWGMFPNFDPYYDPMVMFAVLGMAVVMILWWNGPTLLMPFRSAPPTPSPPPRPPRSAADTSRRSFHHGSISGMLSPHPG